MGGTFPHILTFPKPVRPELVEGRARRLSLRAFLRVGLAEARILRQAQDEPE